MKIAAPLQRVRECSFEVPSCRMLSTTMARTFPPRSSMPMTTVLSFPPVPVITRSRFALCMLRALPPMKVSSISTSLRQLSALLALLSESDPVKHKPRGLLSNTQRPANFATANAVFAIQDQPHCWKPLIQAKRGIFKDGTDLHGELPLGMPRAALPAQLILKEAYLGATADRADNAVFPLRAARDKVVKAVL